MSNFTETSFESGQRILCRRSLEIRKKLGQFLTPPPLARFIASRLGKLQSGCRILDPALGTGTLVCALIERLVAQSSSIEIYIDGYEIDVELFQVASTIIAQAADYAASKDIKVHFRLYPCDFVVEKLTAQNQYHYVLANPPYFKLNQSEAYALMAKRNFKGHTNIYTLFMALALKLLYPEGMASFIVPRSFCSGTYFSAFRKELVEQATPISIHVFESRQDNFESVLQENVVFNFQKKGPSQPITVSSSLNSADFTLKELKIQPQLFLAKYKDKVFFRLPISTQDECILEIMDKWGNTLHDFQLEVSTGAIVPFRTKEYLVDSISDNAVPLLWMHHIKPQQIQTKNGKNKPTGFLRCPESQQHLVPSKNYVLLRRFSAKEEARRLVAAPFLTKDYPYQWIGLENHLNFIYRREGQLSRSEARGLSALLNCGLMDRYFRITNGNTQVNATEIRLLPLPPLSVIQSIGKSIAHTKNKDLDEIVTFALKHHHLLPNDFPIIRETRFA